jgi:hypothetical protein
MYFDVLIHHKEKLGGRHAHNASAPSSYKLCTARVKVHRDPWISSACSAVDMGYPKRLYVYTVSYTQIDLPQPVRAEGRQTGPATGSIGSSESSPGLHPDFRPLTGCG